MKTSNLNKIYEKTEEQLAVEDMARNISINNFQFDQYKVNPLGSYIPWISIDEITNIVTDVGLSTKVSIRNKMIDTIMARYGFFLLFGGTNRRSYYNIYDDRILAKVATDKVGFQNNYDELVNQELLKPYCTKIFELSNNNTIQLAERVIPVTNTAMINPENLFDLLYNIILEDELAISDIGLRSFKNYGIRRGFGLVLLDYPSLFVLSRMKMKCKRVVNGVPCEGHYSYDIGFDNLVCSECGHKIFPKLLSTGTDRVNEVLTRAKAKKKLVNEILKTFSDSERKDNIMKVRKVIEKVNGETISVVPNGSGSEDKKFDLYVSKKKFMEETPKFEPGKVWVEDKTTIEKVDIKAPKFDTPKYVDPESLVANNNNVDETKEDTITPNEEQVQNEDKNKEDKSEYSLSYLKSRVGNMNGFIPFSDIEQEDIGILSDSSYSNDCVDFYKHLINEVMFEDDLEIITESCGDLISLSSNPGYNIRVHGMIEPLKVYTTKDVQTIETNDCNSMIVEFLLKVAKELLPDSNRKISNMAAIRYVFSNIHKNNPKLFVVFKYLIWFHKMVNEVPMKTWHEPDNGIYSIIYNEDMKEAKLPRHIKYYNLDSYITNMERLQKACDYILENKFFYSDTANRIEEILGIEDNFLSELKFDKNTFKPVDETKMAVGDIGVWEEAYIDDTILFSMSYPAILNRELMNKGFSKWKIADIATSNQ